MYLKIHGKDGKKTVAVCDCELLGRVLFGNGMKLDLKKYAGFYKGEKTQDAALIADALLNADSANLVGERCIKIALEKGFASEENVMHIGGVPHLQIYRFSP
ncbi:hypothetical protein COV61_05505 [Candidatus Micrarchaeota archaeon CG11_big_fil_rev_8_21_14_0_20_47_5]|nr:MAG: hypothetical protein AUJ17_03025 [Candidatus Micrarchaeota archaeon CG1_02_47_40]PIN82601.1 MAG: hypothetical protein COV61_05505 [Candidatus Micrarchaeota archaeon CG11_big_fil_rev_8_21_14_0_20_47_5]